jgi:hypothetical protein
MPPVWNTWHPLNGQMEHMFVRNVVIQNTVKAKSLFQDAA